MKPFYPYFSSKTKDKVSGIVINADRKEVMVFSITKEDSDFEQPAPYYLSPAEFAELRHELRMLFNALQDEVVFMIQISHTH